MFHKLSMENRRRMADAPEVAMDIQIGQRAADFVLIIGGRITVRIDQGIVPQLARLAEMMPRDKPESYDGIEKWTEELPEAPFIEPVATDQALGILGFLHLGPIAPLPSPPPWPGSVYGHLPFHGICSGSEVFYRYEHYPNSLRIDKTTGDIKPDTFAAPALELDYVNSGLGAVARYALPSLLPACWRHELHPPKGTAMHYGASVPLFGQSGGGVEVMFPYNFKNAVVPVPAPYVLPIF